MSKEWFASQAAAGTLRGAVAQNPSVAVRELGPLKVIRINSASSEQEAARILAEQEG